MEMVNKIARHADEPNLVRMYAQQMLRARHQQALALRAGDKYSAAALGQLVKGLHRQQEAAASRRDFAQQ